MLTNLRNLFPGLNKYSSASFSQNAGLNHGNIFPSPGERIGDFTVIDLAGSPGGTAAVFICKDKYGRRVAVKRFYPDKNTPVFRDKIIEEASFRIKNNFLVTSEAYFEEGGYIHSVMPYVEGENLRNVLDGCNAVSEDDAVYVIICLAEAAKELHSRNILSSDIKPGNIIISKVGATLIDLSSFERPGLKAEASMGTMPYAAPELINRERLYKATDIYSIGVVFFELLVGSERFSGISERWEDDLRRGIKPGTSFLRNSHPEASRIIEKSLEIDPNRRYTDANSLIVALDSLRGSTVNPCKKCVFVNGRKKVLIPAGRSIVGRSIIAPSNYYISEKQFDVDFSGKLMLRDLSCKNSVFVNKQTIGSAWKEILDADVIQFANIKLKVVLK